jgi:uncharacterized RDD family membrane protein YckC
VDNVAAVSDPTQPPRDPDDPAGELPPEQPPTSPFPESTLTPEDPPPPVEPESEPVTAPTPAPPPEPAATPEREWAAPEPAREWAAPEPAREWAAPAPPSGLTSGDPLGVPGGPPPAPSLPPGYTSPPPPGAGGAAPSAFAPAPGTYRLASWGSRVGAALIDGLIITVPGIIVLVVLGIGAAGSDSDGGTTAFVGGFLLTLLVFLIVALLYAPIMMSRTNGQTVGRMATGIRVIRASGGTMTFGFAALREIVVKGLLIGTVSSFTLGLSTILDSLWPLWDDENRALHDMVVNTRVVKT